MLLCFFTKPVENGVVFNSSWKVQLAVQEELDFEEPNIEWVFAYRFARYYFSPKPSDLSVMLKNPLLIP